MPPIDQFSRGRHPRFPGGVYSPAKSTLPGDLLPKPIHIGGGEREQLPIPDYLQRIDENVDILTLLSTVSRGFSARVFTVTTTPVQIVDGRFLRGYIFLNPSASAGLTTTGTMFASAARTVAGSPYTSGEVGTANFRNAVFFLNVTVLGAGSLISVNLQTQDPLTNAWATAQTDIFGAAGIGATGAYYANVGNVGVDVNMRLVATLTVASATFSISYILKDGLPGSSSGLTRTIYVGDQNVTTTTGYPLLEGQTLNKFYRMNTLIYAVSAVTAGTELRVFDLQ